MATSKPLEPQLVERAAKAIKRNVDHQTRLIDDLLDTSRIVSGKLTIERRASTLLLMEVHRHRLRRELWRVGFLGAVL